MHSDLKSVIKLVYNKCDYSLSNLLAEKESCEYAGCTFELNNKSVKFRTAKITPTKVGQFVTLWKRDDNGITQAHTFTDQIDLFIICTRNGNQFGQFVFPKSVLIEHSIISTLNKDGKRGFRVYPPWDKTENKQAKNTQKWQLNYFLEISETKLLNIERVKLLYSLL